MLIRALFLKVINNERKTLTHHDTIDHNAAHIVQINKPWIHPNLRRPNLSFVYSSKLTYFCIVDILVCLLPQLGFAVNSQFSMYSRPENIVEQCGII